ncbi:hypothetical protein EX30DRAFT_159887 [Ascodesmis nigricans]|uniref:Zn(2)-C6 fungal-type domain-containing protein n=1 Tax=Ascodesmis nigricans TaxID=341454 RepID=A0A4S2MMQ5_9PEZI|nr:hypothetical protein EX30DRAFT_159887 [Ascodesmis nigricans]
MPRAPVAGREIRRRSRNGCWNCKARKVKCGEEKPRCNHCERLDEECDYKIRLSWGGRPLKKKLQQQQNANGVDPNGDDTAFIPGAGQFSLTHHFPAPQTFLSTNSSSGARRPAIPRANSGKKTSMSNYQTVFAVGETTLAPQQPVQTQATPITPPTPTTKVKAEVTSPLAPAVPLNVHIPLPPTSMQPVQPGSQSATSQSNYTWAQPPNSAPPTTSTFNHALINSPPHQATPTGGYFPSQPFSTQPYSSPRQPSTSPIAPYQSPPIKAGSCSPDVQYQPLGSPEPKLLYHPPPHLTSSPSKRPRTMSMQSSTSPTNDPPTSPYLTFPERHLPTMNGHLRYMDTPITSAPMNEMTELHLSHPAVTGIGVGSNIAMRRVSVDQLLSGPLQAPMEYSGVLTAPYPAVSDSFEVKTEPTPTGIPVTTLAMQDDEDVEEIRRTAFENFPSDSRFTVNSLYPGTVTIARTLLPYPPILLDNDKNRMYFDHYLKFTARLLVPHDCSENPFRYILPQMAIKTDHLMNLLLAYSASHQARLLGAPEPTERISQFIGETVRSLHLALGDTETATSDASLATAIMLASYQIITPNPFEQSGLTWRLHLNAARKIVQSRGGAQGTHSNDPVSYFLGRWFAYLDLIGRLSGREVHEPISSGEYWTSDNESERDQYTVDCFFGFTRRCITILANIGELARQCDIQRRKYRNAEDGFILSDGNGWNPPTDVHTQALILRQELVESYKNSLGKCGDHDHSGSDFDESELLEVNSTFHRAAEIYLYRRVLGYPSEDKVVQSAVGNIVATLPSIRMGGTAENCLLFPMFTAGCEAQSPAHRGYIRERMKSIEKTGLAQVRNARILMERVWAEHVPWWEIVNGEFIG